MWEVLKNFDDGKKLFLRGNAVVIEVYLVFIVLISFGRFEKDFFLLIYNIYHWDSLCDISRCRSFYAFLYICVYCHSYWIRLQLEARSSITLQRTWEMLKIIGKCIVVVVLVEKIMLWVCKMIWHTHVNCSTEYHYNTGNCKWSINIYF